MSKLHYLFKKCFSSISKINVVFSCYYFNFPLTLSFIILTFLHLLFISFFSSLSCFYIWPLNISDFFPLLLRVERLCVCVWVWVCEWECVSMWVCVCKRERDCARACLYLWFYFVGNFAPITLEKNCNNSSMTDRWPSIWHSCQRFFSKPSQWSSAWHIWIFMIRSMAGIWQLSVGE